jgi:hypothetical protein
VPKRKGLATLVRSQEEKVLDVSQEEEDSKRQTTI